MTVLTPATAASAQPPSDAPAVRLTGVGKSFGGAAAVSDVDLTIAQNEFFSILGPSGCGKTTLMRMITGFETPTTGTVELGGRDATGLPPHRRDLNMLFQSYALFPHLTVAENVGFELRVRKLVPRSEIPRVVEEALALVRLEGFGKRTISQLSGGQKQRIALARALVSRPSLILLDEPLGALDQKLRLEMQLELKRLQREVGVTFIYVTHDQEEALTMSDRIAVMNGGRVLQVDTPEAIYDRPAVRFVAGFIGTSSILSGTVAARGAHRVLEVPGIGTLPLPANDLPAGSTAHLSLRPEDLRVEHVRAEQAGAPAGDGRFALEAVLQQAVYLGHGLRYHCTLADGTTVQIEQTGRDGRAVTLSPGDTVRIAWRPEDGRVLPD
ncbi:ABC transporter ATP-binding protein [Peterkaempfera bronchialis]|uniref:Spermidine/putrescine import ATP-binding protein PotA n=1 Tax=Peterkaempfera bronchialis TaxID=2126346 RepID=A0A345SWT9_9ACTN|nr:ABC transporter ATP-binding protein [Peterkaempfera bronchialis]AXI78194.1 ABC transporter ATP-binding protein [Peterkaempfera bronchialis]